MTQAPGKVTSRLGPWRGRPAGKVRVGTELSIPQPQLRDSSLHLFWALCPSLLSTLASVSSDKETRQMNNYYGLNRN